MSLTGPGMSLTGLDTDPPAGKGLPMKSWDTDTSLSLTGLVAELTRIQGDLRRIVGQVGHG